MSRSVSGGFCADTDQRFDIEVDDRRQQDDRHSDDGQQQIKQARYHERDNDERDLDHVESRGDEQVRRDGAPENAQLPTHHRMCASRPFGQMSIQPLGIDHHHLGINPFGEYLLHERHTICDLSLFYRVLMS
jgi:hypothetical protein